MGASRPGAKPPIVSMFFEESSLGILQENYIVFDFRF
jgi:hypothetical protein